LLGGEYKLRNSEKKQYNIIEVTPCWPDKQAGNGCDIKNESQAVQNNFPVQ